MITYNGIISGVDLRPKKASDRITDAARIYLGSFPLNLRLWNLSERRGILETITRERITV